MIRVNDKSNCCGCNACGDICNKNAISFHTDIEGFWYPEVNTELCNNCEACENVCPIINIDKLRHNDFKVPICYASIHKNLEVRFDSTSGGLFSAFAEKMYRDKGYVGGAIYNDDWSVKQYISADKEDLPKLRSSKYQQSSFEGFYRTVRNLVKQGEKVLVCGSPCQMAALRAFLNHKNYENLLILDYVCRGINSPLVAQKFNDYLEEKHKSKIVYKKAKNKELGWRLLNSKFVFENGDVDYQNRENSMFNHGYLQTNAFCRPSCYECKFKGFPRIADITLADFWGIEKVDKSMDDNLGTSLVLINSEKGKIAFDSIAQKIKAVKLPYEAALNGNPALVKSITKTTIDRNHFFDDIHSLRFDEVAKKYFYPSRSENVSSVLNWRFHARIIKGLLKNPDLDWRSRIKFLKLNYFHKGIKARKANDAFLYPMPYSLIDISPNSSVVLNARLRIGKPRMKGSRLETRFLVEDGATIEINSPFSCMYGSDIEVFRGAKLIVKGAEFYTNGGSNIGLTIICANRIEIGYHVMMGRNVTIRDNNGGHYLNMQGYKDTRPVIIGNHVWLCESCTIMSGVKIGDGAVVGAHSVVTTNVPANCLVMGNPARIVQRNIQWKY